MSDDFSTTATDYFTAGWLPFPLPPGEKSPPPRGVTGRVGAPPSGPDVYEWCELAPPGANIGLRMPETVIGIDVDHYDDKNGAATLLEHIKRLCPLPPTWRSSARDWPSGIWFYRVPAGLAFPEKLTGGGVELIRCIHRYAVVWPSTNPKTGTQYRWYRPLNDDYGGEEESDRPPRVDELPYLPDEWIADLTGWRTDTEVASAALDASEAMTWLDAHDEPGTCPRVAGRAQQIITAIRAGTAHDSLSQLVTMARLAEHGHRGVGPLLDDIATAFAHVAVAHGRTPNEAAAEFTRSWRGAVGKIVATAEVEVPVAPCDCGEDPEDLVDRTPPPLEPDTPPDAPPDTPEPSTWDRLLAQKVAEEKLRREARRTLDAEEAAAAFRPPVFVASLSNELELPDLPVPYSVNELMPTGANVVLAAQFKAGKTTLINHLTKCLVDGEEFLGKYAVKPGRVALWNYEVERNQYRRWLRDVGIENTDDVIPLNLRGYRMPLISPKVQDWTIEWLREHEITTWIIDPYARALVGSAESENNNTEVGHFLDTLDVIKERAGVTDLVMPAHTGRAEMEAGQERTRGATRLDDWADVRWLLTKDDQDVRYFRASGRDVETDEAQLYYRELTRTLSLSGGSREQAKRSGAEHAVLQAIQARPGMGVRELRGAVRAILRACSNDKITEAVERLESQGRIRVDEGRGRTPSSHWPTTVDDLVDEGEDD